MVAASKLRGETGEKGVSGREPSLISPQTQVLLSGAAGVLSMNSNEAQRRAEAAFKREKQSHEAQQAMAEYQAAMDAMREKTARLRALRLARDAGLKTPVPAAQKQSG